MSVIDIWPINQPTCEGWLYIEIEIVINHRHTGLALGQPLKE